MSIICLNRKESTPKKISHILSNHKNTSDESKMRLPCYVY